MTDWNKEEALAALTYPIDLPKAAWQLALQHYDDIKNELYAALKLSPERIYALSAKHGSSYDLQFFAFYMVAEKRDTQALPLICDFFAKYGKEASKVTGDMATEDLPKILASVGFEQADVLYQHASTDSGMDIWGKGACIDALGILMHHGYLPREQLLDWYIDLLQSKLEADLIESMIFNCIRLGFEECKATILKLIEQGYDIKHRFDIADIHNIKKGKIEEAYVHQHLSMVDNSLDLLHRFYDTESGSNQPSSSISFLSMDETIPLLPLLKHLPDEDGIAYLHGYVYAVVYTPEVIMPSEWLDPLLKNITFGSNEKTSSLMSGLMQVYNRLNEQRLESLLKCPITKEHFTNARTFDDIESWSRGFLDGIKHRPWLWGAEESVRGEKLSDIDVAWTIMLAIVDADIAEEMLQKSKKPDDGEQERVAFYASLYGGFLSAEQTMVDYVRAQEGESSGILPNVIPLRSHKVGRNKPCTCGSGKKFKKCCGSAARTVH